MTREFMDKKHQQKVAKLSQKLLKEIYLFTDHLDKKDDNYVDKLAGSLAGISGQIRAILFNIVNGMIMDSYVTESIFKAAQDRFSEIYEKQENKKNDKK